MVNRWAQGAPYGTTAIPYIGENGNWWVNQEDTGVKAQGPQGPQGLRGEAGIGAPGPALMYEDMTKEQKLELASHYTDDMQAIKDSCIADTNALIATAKTEMDATKAATLEEAATIAEETTAGIVNAAVENAQAEIDASVATATTNINAAAANAENSKVAAQEAANSATATLESMQNIKQEAITAAQNAAAETATSTVNTLVEQAQADIDANITEAKNVATAAATNADASKVEANTSANSAASSATAAANSATEANAAKTAAEAAANSVTLDADAMNAAVQASKSYAVGGTGTREGEDADNSKYYYGLCKTLAEGSGSNYMGECAYADLPADAPVGAVYKITVDENGEPVYLLTEAELTEINNAIDAAYKNNNVQLMITASARAIEKTYDNQSLFIKTSSGWEPYVQNVTHMLMDTLLVAFSMVAGPSGLTTELVDTITNLKKQMGYSYYPSFDEIPYDNVLLPYCAGVNTTGDTYTVIQEANSSSVVVKGAMKTDAFDCVLTESLSLPSGDYTAVLTCASSLNDYYTAFTVSIIDTADGSVKAKWDKNDITNSLTNGNTFVRFMTSSDTVAKVMLHIEGMSNARGDAYLTLGVFNAQLYSSNFADVVKTIKRTQDSTLNYIHATTCKTLEEVDAVTESGHLVDAMAVKELDGKIAYGNAGSHNSIYRGKYLGDAVTDAQYAAIAAGTFDDLFIGDYWTIGDVNYRIAAFDYYFNAGNVKCTAHHAVIVPDSCLYSHVMNDTDVTTSGYVGSKMYTEGLAQAKTTIKAAFSGHVLSHKIYLTNAAADGKPSAGAWRDSEVDLMCEEMVCGGGVFRPTSDGSTAPQNFRIEKSQLPLFAHEPSRACTRMQWWLRDVVTVTGFAYVSNNGGVYYGAAGYSMGVRPAFCIC